MAERNVENESKAVDVLVDLWDETISKMTNTILEYPNRCVGIYEQHDIQHYLDKLDEIEEALRRLLTPLLKP